MYYSNYTISNIVILLIINYHNEKFYLTFILNYIIILDIIMKKLLILLTLPLLGLFSHASHAVVAGGIVAINHQWPFNGQYTKMSFFQQINQDGGTKSHYYWANQFFFKGGDGAYIGLQNRSGGVKAVNYSIWGASSWKSGKCNNFGHEGTGVQCELIYPWAVGHAYRLDVSKNGNIVTGTVTDLNDNKSTQIAQIEVPSTYGKLYASSGFVEEYSQGNQQLPTCYTMGAENAVFKNPIADNTVVARQTTYTYGACNDPYIVEASCNSSSCQNTINDLKNIPSPFAPSIAVTNGQEITQDQLKTALSGENLIVIQMQDGKWSPKVSFPSASNLPWKSITIDQKAGYSTTLYMNNTTVQVAKGQNVTYTSISGVWKKVN
ncbi:unnamed protein product [Commensalibacter communis]|nr:unnamed protein product [Commensalibacter communis]CAI3960006.1 unnamed protein product [Commensalibacter communis]